MRCVITFRGRRLSLLGGASFPSHLMASVRRAIAAALLTLSCSAVPPLLPFRPPAVPLIVQSPFISIWSPSNALTDTDTQLWSGAPARISGLLRVDGVAFRWLGASPLAPPATQSALAAVTATRTRVALSAGGVDIAVTFTSPRVLDDSNTTLLATPASFLEWSLSSSDGAAHAVALYVDADATLLTNQSTTSTPVTWSRVALGSGRIAVRFGAESQWPLSPVVCGQSVPLTASQTITWGWAYLVADGDGGGVTTASAVGSTAAARASFVANGTLPADDPAPPRTVGDGAPGAALAWSLALPASGAATRVRATFFFDEILAASYYAGVKSWTNNPAAGVFVPLWRRDLPFNDTVGVPSDAIASAHSGADDAAERADAFDASVFALLASSGSASLATWGSLVYRQIVGAFAPIWHTARGELWAFFKEMGSGGDFSTVDVLYPASPIFAALAPGFLRAALLPGMVASGNVSTCSEPYVKHDLGKFPLATSTSAGEAMPLEETANLMHMLAAIAMRDGGDVTWLAPFFAQPAALPRWCDFLVASLPVVPTQGSTDDFLGVVHNSTNLGVKGAVGLAAYGILASMAGNASAAEAAWEWAAYSAAVNTQRGFFVDTVAAGGVNASHWCWGWGFCDAPPGSPAPPSTFLMYNFGYARILRMHALFPAQAELLARQAAYYEAHTEGPFGISLQNGTSSAMAEWNAFFVSSLMAIPNASSPAPPLPPLALRVFDALLRAANDTSFRAPMTDFWDSRTAYYGGKYRARPVVGGVWAPAAVSIFDALPPFPHEAPMAAAFERGRARARAAQVCSCVRTLASPCGTQ